MIKKPLKANLIIDGELCRNIEEMKENFNLVDVLREFENGNLLQFAKKRAFKKSKELEELDKNGDLKKNAEKICELFDIERNEILLNKEVELYKFSKLNKEDKEKFLQIEEQEFNLLKPSILGIKIKNSGEIFPSNFKFIPIKTNLVSNVILSDFSGKELSSLKIKTSAVFDGLIIKNFPKIEDENFQKAYNIAQNSIENFLAWSLENSSLAQAKFSYFSIKNSLSTLENSEAFWKKKFDFYKKNNEENYEKYKSEVDDIWAAVENAFSRKIDYNLAPKFETLLHNFENIIKEGDKEALWLLAKNSAEEAAALSKTLAKSSADLAHAAARSANYSSASASFAAESISYSASSAAHSCAYLLYSSAYSALSSTLSFESSTKFANKFFLDFLFSLEEFLKNNENPLLKEKLEEIKNLEFQAENYSKLRILFQNFLNTFKDDFELTLVDLYSKIKKYKNKNWDFVE